MRQAPKPFLKAQRPQTAAIHVRTGSSRRAQVVHQLTVEEIELQKQNVFMYQKEYDAVKNQVRTTMEKCRALEAKMKYKRQVALASSGTAASEEGPGADGSAFEEEAAVENAIRNLKDKIREADNYTKTLKFMKYRLQNQTQFVCANLTIWQRRQAMFLKEQQAIETQKRTLENELVVLEASLEDAMIQNQRMKLENEHELDMLRMEMEEKERITTQRQEADRARFQMLQQAQNPHIVRGFISSSNCSLFILICVCRNCKKND